VDHGLGIACCDHGPNVIDASMPSPFPTFGAPEFQLQDVQVVDEFLDPSFKILDAFVSSILQHERQPRHEHVCGAPNDIGTVDNHDRTMRFSADASKDSRVR
jgi:hypothetical protein